MGSNLENDRTVTSSKMYPIDLASQKITIVKSVANSEVKMAHLISPQPKTTGTGQIITHTGPIGLMRAATQILSTGVPSQSQVLMSSSPIIQGPQIVSQGSQIISQGQQIISQPQLISSQLLNQSTQIISQGQSGTQGTLGNINVGTQIGGTPVSGTQVLNVSGQLVSGTSNLVVSSSVRALSPNVRVLPPLPHHNTRPVTVQNATASVVVSKSITSHVPRGPVAGASLAVPRVATRPITPSSSSLPISSLGANWSGAPRVRNSLVYSARPPIPRVTGPRVMPAAGHSTIVTLPATTVLTSASVITGIRGPAPRPLPAPAPNVSVSLTTQRPIPLVQRNCPTAKVVGVANVGMRGVGNSAPSQLYYEVPRPAATVVTPAPAQHVTPLPARVLAPYNHVPQNNTQVNVANTVQVIPEGRLPTASILATSILPRPSILRKRDLEGSPTKVTGVPPMVHPYEMRQEETDLGHDRNLHRAPSPAGSGRGSGGGSTTVSAASSPGPDDEPLSPPRAPSPQDISPRKKPRKQILSGVRHCDFTTEERPRTPPPAPAPPPKRPLLSSSFVCGWRATALHFARPADVRRREPRAAELPAIAAQPHVLSAAQGWKVHHLTAQMDDLVSLEADVSEQLSHLLRSLEGAHGKAQTALAPHSHTLLELVKGNIQRSKIVCEGIRESREDVLRVFTHRTFVADILTRQGDKRSFRKHRSQS